MCSIINWRVHTVYNYVNIFHCCLSCLCTVLYVSFFMIDKCIYQYLSNMIDVKIIIIIIVIMMVSCSEASLFYTIVFLYRNHTQIVVKMIKYRVRQGSQPRG